MKCLGGGTILLLGDPTGKTDAAALALGPALGCLSTICAINGSFGPVAGEIIGIGLGSINDDPRLDMGRVGQGRDGKLYYRIGYDISKTNSTTQGVTRPIENTLITGSIIFSLEHPTKIHTMDSLLEYT